MTEFASNAHNDKRARAQPEKTKKLAPVVRGTVVERKKPLSKRFRESFLSGQGIKGLWSHVLSEVIVPAAKDAAFDALRVGGQRAIFGDSVRFPTGSRQGQTSYSGFYRPSGSTYNGQNNAPPQQRDISRRERSQHDMREIVLENRGEAEMVLETLYSILADYNQTTIADFYELVGITSEYTDMKYGWTSLQGSKVSHVRGGGYVIDLPRPQVLK